MSGGTDAIELDGVSMAFELADGAVDVLRGITLTIRQGDFVSLLGPSGCGKSTLLPLTATPPTPTGGCVWGRGPSPGGAGGIRAGGGFSQRALLRRGPPAEATVAPPRRMGGGGGRHPPAAPPA